MGTGFCNLNCLGWNTQTPLPLLSSKNNEHYTLGKWDEKWFTGGTHSIKKQISDQKWDTTKNKRRCGTTQPYTNGR
jgi:hypothetical protein